MKRVVLVLIVLAASTSAFAQSEVDKALLAAPANLRDDATVIKWKADFTYQTLRKGTNQLVCYDRSGFPEQEPFSVQCTNLANLPREAQNLKYEAMGDRVKSQAALDALEKNGTRAKPEYGSVWYAFAGPDQKHAEHDMTIAVPYATAQSSGFPDTPRLGGVWLMDAGTSTAHLMTP